jgi:TRAP-type C4-dicarboxylate transport system permease small subunit|tara:strand:- start:1701 stop:2162 length:462 start_codon:yes stop_codon:yes gene_type:complete
MAVFGGVILFILAILTTISVFGRKFLDAPVPGDFELVAIGTGVAVFACLPYCQLMRGNVLVDFFMNNAPTRAKTIADIIAGLIFLAIGLMLTWRMIYGAIDMHDVNEVSMTIGFPRWSTFPISIVFMSFLVIIIIYTLGRSIAETRANRYFNE